MYNNFLILIRMFQSLQLHLLTMISLCMLS